MSGISIPNINDKDEDGRTELHHAAIRNDSPRLQLLLFQGADVNFKDNQSKTPLHYAAIENEADSHFRVSETLLTYGADVNALDSEGETPVSYLVRKGSVKMMQSFLKFNVKLNIVNDAKETLLFPAVLNNNLEVLRLLVDLGLDLNHHCDKRGRTSLHVAAETNVGESHYEAAETLLKNRADVNAQEYTGLTPLWYLVRNSTRRMMQLFLSYKADAEIINRKGLSLLFPALENHENADVFQLLVDLGLDPNACEGEDDSTLLHLVAEKSENDSHLQLVEVLLKNKAQVDSRDSQGLTPLWYLVKKNNPKTLQLFIKFKAYANVVNADGENLLFPALSCNKNAGVLQQLLDLGLNANHTSDDEKTPLHEAAIDDEAEGRLKIVEVLLNNGADIDARDQWGRTPIWYFVETCKEKIVREILKYKPDLDYVDDSEENLLFPAAAGNKDEGVMQLLINLGLNVNHRNKDGGTPLHCACFVELENVKVVKCLLRAGADVSAVDDLGRTTLINAMNAVIHDLENQNKNKFDFILKHKEMGPVNEYLHSSFFGSIESYILKRLLEHFAKLESLDIPVHPSMLNRISGRAGWKNYYEGCKKELLEAKSTRLKNSWVTLYDLLIDDRRKFKNYAGNADLIGNFEKSNYREKFTIYGGLMDENVKKGIKRRELFDKASITLSYCLPIFNPNHLIVRDILDCIMSKKDLVKLCYDFNQN